MCADNDAAGADKDAPLDAEHKASANVLPQFALPVDAEHKATVLAIPSLARPHMLAFHCSWLGFFTSFVSTRFIRAAGVPGLG